MNTLIKIFLQGVSIFAVTYVLPGIRIQDFWYALVVAAIMALVNATIKPILQFLTFPITLFTFGLFLLVINACMVLLVDYFVDEFWVRGFWTALFFSILVSFLYSFLDKLFVDRKRD